MQTLLIRLCALLGFVIQLGRLPILGAEPEPANYRQPPNDGELGYWLENMVWHHRFSEDEIVSAMRTVWERMKIIIEPSSAVAVAPLLRAEGAAVLGLPPRSDGQPLRIGIILSGGNLDLSSVPFRST